MNGRGRALLSTPADFDETSRKRANRSSVIPQRVGNRRRPARSAARPDRLNVHEPVRDGYNAAACPNVTKTTSPPAGLPGQPIRSRARPRHRGSSKAQPSRWATPSASASTTPCAVGIDGGFDSWGGSAHSKPPRLDSPKVASLLDPGICSTSSSMALRCSPPSRGNCPARSRTSTSRAGSSHRSWSCRARSTR